MQQPELKARPPGRIGLAIVSLLLAGFVLAGQTAAQGERTERFFEDWVVVCVEQQGFGDALQYQRSQEG